MCYLHHAPHRVPVPVLSATLQMSLKAQQDTAAHVVAQNMSLEARLMAQEQENKEQRDTNRRLAAKIAELEQQLKGVMAGTQ